MCLRNKTGTEQARELEPENPLISFVLVCSYHVRSLLEKENGVANSHFPYLSSVRRTMSRRGPCYEI